MCTFFPTVKNQDLYTRKTKDKVVVLCILIFTALECKINCNNQNKIKFNFSNPTILPKGNWAIFMLVAAGQEGRTKWFDQENLKRQEQWTTRCLTLCNMLIKVYSREHQQQLQWGLQSLAYRLFTTHLASLCIRNTEVVLYPALHPSLESRVALATSATSLIIITSHQCINKTLPRVSLTFELSATKENLWRLARMIAVKCKTFRMK